MPEHLVIPAINPGHPLEERPQALKVVCRYTPARAVGRLNEEMQPSKEAAIILESLGSSSY